MVSKISEGIEVSVETFYQPDYSNPVSGEYMFAYRITIENHNNFSVKLLRRHWYIIDSNSSTLPSRQSIRFIALAFTTGSSPLQG